MLLTTRDAADNSLALFYEGADRPDDDGPLEMDDGLSAPAVLPSASEGVTGAGGETLDRENLIGLIIRANPSASEEFLRSFGDRSLSNYLAHLDTVTAPRGASWERPADSPAIVSRDPVL